MATLHAAAFSQSRPWSQGEFSNLLQNPACFAVGDTGCFALAHVIVDEVELLTIATHPACQQQGLARICMTDWQAEAHQRGAVRAFLEVAADNSAAIALYQSCGFEACGQRKAYYRRAGGEFVDALVLARRLP
jgi:ribosomal-protein-alanine N-acetyltransferase